MVPVVRDFYGTIMTDEELISKVLEKQAAKNEIHGYRP
jgi:hypothetical protein